MKRCTAMLVLTLMLSGFSQGDLRRDMVSFDKVYIAALALTSQGNAAASRKAVVALQQSWQSFKAAHSNANPADKQWRPDFDAVEKMVATAAAIVAAPALPVTQAHEALEEVRTVLMKLRQRNRIEYYIDGLTAFHHPMEAIVLAAKDKDGQSLNESDIATIRATLPEAEHAWQSVTQRKLDAATYRLSAVQTDDALKLVKVESAALAALKDALAANDKARIAKAAVGIKPSFAKLFMTFADFAPYAQQ